MIKPPLKPEDQQKPMGHRLVIGKYMNANDIAQYKAFCVCGWEDGAGWCLYFNTPVSSYYAHEAAANNQIVNMIDKNGFPEW